MEKRGARTKQRNAALMAPRSGQHLVERPGGARQHPVEHRPRQPIERTESGHAGRRGERGRQQHRVEHGAGPSRADLEHRRVGKRVNRVEHDDVVAVEELEQTAVVRLSVGQVEVAQDRHLVHRPACGRIGRDARDPCGVGMRAGDLDAHAGLAQHGPMYRPGHRRHVVAA